MHNHFAAFKVFAGTATGVTPVAVISLATTENQAVLANDLLLKLSLLGAFLTVIWNGWQIGLAVWRWWKSRHGD